MRIGIVCTARPSWSKLLPVVRALTARHREVFLYMAGGAVLVKYGAVVEQARVLFPSVTIREVFSVLDGATLVTSAKETAGLLHSLADLFSLDGPDCIVVNHDRHEVVGVAQAAAYLHLPIIHIGGGERSGSIDDRCRDAITALANVHCVSTRRAQLRVWGMTGSEQVHWTGCPSIDIAKEAQASPPVTWAELNGTGPLFDLREPFLIVLQHPVTNEMDQAGAQLRATLEAVTAIPLPRIVFQPGEDAGAEAMAREIRQWRHTDPLAIYTVKNFPPDRFLRLLTQASVLVGNSSAGIREASYLGVPVVNIGSRQQGRERAGHVRDVGYDTEAIWAATCAQIQHGPYPSSALYGDGRAGEKIADVICERVRADTRAVG